MPASVLKLIQIGDENTWGTDTAATAKLMGVISADANQADEIESVGDLGTAMPSVAAALKKTSAEMTISQRASYQDIVYWMHGLFGAATASAAANTTYAYKYTAPAATAVITPEAYTVEYGEPTSAAYQMTGGLVRELTLKGDAASGLWTADVTLVGKTLKAEAMTSGISARTVDIARFADTSLYIDAWGGTIGSTAVAATLISAELRVSNGLHLKHFAGAATPQNYGLDRWEGELTLVLEFNTTDKAYVDAMLAPAVVQKLIRLLATQGATSALRVMRIDFAGTLIDGVKLFDDRDGNMTISLKFNGVYSPAAAMLSWLKVYVKNELSVMP